MKFKSSRFAIYRTICEQLDTLNKITNVTESFHEMTSELGVETSVYVAQAEWVHGEPLCIPGWYCHLCDNFLSGFKQRVSSSLRSRQERCDASSKGTGINQKGKLVIRK